MAEQPNNPRRKSPRIEAEEATEAKLCAYLEDALPPAERAEIEQYLASNPAHRKLLAELATGRQWLMNLPRQPAPPDISEAFQQQLERSMLLDDATEAGGAAPLNRWPQRMLIAALVLLAAGLGVVVYLALPGSTGSSSQRFAANPPAAPPAPMPMPMPASAAPLAAAAPYQRAAAALAPPPPPRPNIAALVPAPVTRPSVAAAEPATAQPTAVALGSTASTAEQTAAPRWVSHTLLMTASTTQPVAIAQRIADFCTAAGVQYHRIHLTGTNIHPPASAPSAVVDGSAPPRAEPPPPTTDQSAMVSTSFNPSTNTHVMVIQTRFSKQAGSFLPSRDGRELADEFTLTDIAPDLAVQLRKALEIDFPGDAFRVSDESPAATTAPTTAPAAPAMAAMATGGGADAMIVSRNQLLTVTIDQLSGPGVDKVNRVRVAPDGTLTLPMMIEPVPAAGKSVAQLDQDIARRYRDANLIPNATVHTTAATQPAGELAPAQTQPALATAAASTQPSATARLNLMVLVESLPPATAPTTAP